MGKSGSAELRQLIDQSSLGALLFPGPLTEEQKQRLHDKAEELLKLMVEYLDPVPPEPFRNSTEWSIDHRSRMKCLVLWIRG